MLATFLSHPSDRDTDLPRLGTGRNDEEIWSASRSFSLSHPCRRSNCGGGPVSLCGASSPGTRPRDLPVQPPGRLQGRGLPGRLWGWPSQRAAGRGACAGTQKPPPPRWRRGSARDSGSANGW